MLKQLIIILTLLFPLSVGAQPVRLLIASEDMQVVNIFSDVDDFVFIIDMDINLAPGVIENPTITRVNYQVVGALAAGTPSGFSQFNLQRDISGEEFYAQGSSLMFEIADFADFSDGIQASELIDNGTILSLNAREIDNGRFHPPLLELYFGGTGRIQNSNNVPSLDPLLEVEFGAEYINDLGFDAGSLTLMSIIENDIPPIAEIRDAGSGSLGLLSFLLFLMISWNRRITGSS